MSGYREAKHITTHIPGSPVDILVYRIHGASRDPDTYNHAVLLSADRHDCQGVVALLYVVGARASLPTRQKMQDRDG